ncbi:MAG: hypothetical protein SVM80_03620 [Halobacteriota archaeon]|nr:hypothetical protein [Halobacteriota archaeon]
MDVRKGLISGVVAGISLFFIGWLMEAFTMESLFLPYYEATPELWNPIGTTVAFEGVVVALVVGILMGAIYTIFYRAIPSGGVFKGLIFGLMFFLISDVPSFFNLQLLIPIPDEVIMYWFLKDLISFLVSGTVLAMVYESVK